MFYKIEDMRALGGLELDVLLAVAGNDGEAHGLLVRAAVSEARGREISVGATYTTLTRLEAKGLLASRTTDPLPVRGGRSRKEYRLTAAAHEALAAERDRAARRWAGVPGPGAEPGWGQA